MVLTANLDLPYQDLVETRKYANKASSNTIYSYEEIARHGTRDSAWVVINNNVYDVTEFVKRHPGGDAIILSEAGKKDCTDVFTAMHNATVFKYLPAYQIGRTEDWGKEATEFAKDFRELELALHREGLFEAKYWFFAAKMAVNFAALGFSAYLAATTTSLWTTALAGAALAFFWHQMGFMSHDLLHNGVFPSVKMNSFFGWLSTTVFFGISSSQWKEEHNVHHAITNQVHEDLQFTYLPVFLLHWKELLYGKGKQLPWWSTYVLRIQCFLLVPICIFIGRFNIYQVTFRHALGQRDDALRIGQFSLKEVVGLGLFWAYFLTLCSLLPSASHIAVYVVMSHWLVGILHLQLLLNHMAMEFFQGTEQQEIEWFRVQLSSSRNIRSNWMTHWFHGGLQYQIEHHLFPRLPRHNLGQVAPRVRALCKKYDVPYVLDSFLDTVWDVLKDMYNNYWQNKPVIEANIKQYEADSVKATISAQPLSENPLSKLNATALKESEEKQNADSWLRMRTSCSEEKEDQSPKEASPRAE